VAIKGNGAVSNCRLSCDYSCVEGFLSSAEGESPLRIFSTDCKFNQSKIILLA